MSRNSLFILGAAAVAVVLVVVLTIFGFPPSDRDVVGTMGAAPGEASIEGVEQANRYRASQVTETDLTLDDPEIQMLLQDDEVLEVLQSPEFQNAISDDALRLALAEPSFKKAITNDERLREALGRTMLERTEQRHVEFNRSQLERTMGSDLAREIAHNDALTRTLAANDDLARAIAANEDLARALSRNEQMQDVFANRTALEILSRTQFQMIAQRPGFNRATESQFLRTMSDRDLQRTIFERAQQSPVGDVR